MVIGNQLDMQVPTWQTLSMAREWPEAAIKEVVLGREVPTFVVASSLC